MKNIIQITLCLLLVVARFQAANCQVDSDFWFVVPELSYRNAQGGKPGRLIISTLELEATVTISMPANSFDPVSNPTGFQNITVDIPGNSTATVDLSHLIDDAANPMNNLLENKNLTPDGINGFGLHIESTNLVNIYWSVDYTAPTGPGGADIWTLKGSNALGTLFYTPFQTLYNNRNMIPVAYSAIDVVATQDNTQVTFTLPAGKAASFGLPENVIAAGGSHTVTLNRGQTFSLFPVNKSIAAGDRLAGTRIESTHPIAVTLNDDAVAVGPSGADVVGDQLIPVDVTGDHYIVPEISNPNHIYIVATEPNTSIYVYDPNGLPIGASPYTTINAGEQALIIVPNGVNYARITSRTSPADPFKPFYVFQMGLENNARGGALVPPIGCTGNTQLAFTRAFDDNKFYIFIIVEKGNEDKFLVNGVRRDAIIDPGGFTEIQGSGGYMAYFSGPGAIPSGTLPLGQHLVTNTGGIFHLGILNGFPGLGQGQKINYGYYSDFGNLNIGANIAGTNSQVVRACHADPVQLYAYGGTTYQWTPDSYLDDATSNFPVAYNLPPGPHYYTVEVSGACGSGSVPLTVLVAQPVTAFLKSDISSGCSPLEVTFTDQSDGGYSWRFDPGDGSAPVNYDLNSATAHPPPPDPFTYTHTYTNTTSEPIGYQVTYLVRNESGCADFFTKTIVVYPEIESDFAVDVDEGCHPLEVSFENMSTGNTDTWYWDFGDGGSSVEENPVHTYRNLFGPDSEMFTARLVAISPYFCRDTSWHPITVKPHIEALFTFDEVSSCTPYDVEISNQSFGADSYFWDFGDGTTSTTSDPVIYKTFVNSGTVPVVYTITLLVENDEGCFDIMERELTVFPDVTAEFIPVPDEGCSPLAVGFINNSSGAASYQWDFGDGGSSSEADPVHIYDRNLTGDDLIYTVRLVAVSADYCTDTAFYDVTVHPWIEASFAAESVTGCHPFDIEINNLSTGADTYHWDFGDGTTSATSDPVIIHTYRNTTGGTVVYPLALIVENNQGCTDTLIRHITVHSELTANFLPDILEGCHPLTVSFTDMSVSAATWHWDFGDGATSVLPNPVHTFTNYGTSDSVYIVTLTTTSGDGLCMKTVAWPIRVQGISEAAFSVSTASGCSPSEIIFENQSTGGSEYTWDFGDGTIINTTDTGPVAHIFSNPDFTVSRDYEVILRVENYAGCDSEERKTVTIHPDIEAGLAASTTGGCHPLTVDFTNLSNGGQTYRWDFGDGSSSFLENTSHTFTNYSSGDIVYTVKLLAIAPNNICRDSVTIDILVHPYVRADFSIPLALDCSPSDVVFENNSVNGALYHWDLGDGSTRVTTGTEPFVHTFINPDFDNGAEFLVTLIAENHAGCPDEITRSVRVHPAVEAAFSASVAEGCHPLTVSFGNESRGGDTWLWEFGDGSSSQSFSPVYTFHNYTAIPQTHQVRLTVWSRDSCVSEEVMDITIHPSPVARYETDRVIACPPFDLEVHNTSLNAANYRWDFGDGTIIATSSDGPVSHIYENSTDDIAGYDLKLIAESSFGCLDSTWQSMYVYPGAVAAFSSVTEGCSPLTVHFENNSVRGRTYHWDLDNGITMRVAEPTYIYHNPAGNNAVFTVTLTTTTQHGCRDTATDDITVYPQPVAEFIALPTHQVYPSATVSLVNETNQGSYQYSWDMGDGSSAAGRDPGPHIYGHWGEYIITMNVYNAHCSDSVSRKVRIIPPPPVALFDSLYSGCVPLDVRFRNRSQYGNSYLWEFDDGHTSSEFEPVHTFTEPGLYNVRLTVSGDGGVAYSYRMVEVYRKPVVLFRVAPELVMLPDQEIQLFNMSEYGVSWLWDFGDGNTSFEKNPAHLYSETGIYTISLDVWTEHECTDRLILPESVTVEGRGFIKYPNAFRPDPYGTTGGYYDLNEPTRNHIFRPLWEGVIEYRLHIYNRWGELLYISDDVMKGWDGYYQGSIAKQDVYVWKAWGTFSNGRKFVLAGDVTLLR